MSEQENQNPAQSPEAADAPPAAATPPPPPAAPRPVAPTVPLISPPRPIAPGAGAPPAPRPPGPPAPVGSKTIPLSQPPARPTTPMVGKQTTKIAGAAPITKPLPRATVKLQPTGSLTSAAAPLSSVNVRIAALDDDDDETNNTPLTVMSSVALVASIAALCALLACFYVEATPENDEVAARQWMAAVDPQPYQLPMDYSPFDTKNENGTITKNYDKSVPTIPERPKAP